MGRWSRPGLGGVPTKTRRIVRVDLDWTIDDVDNGSAATALTAELKAE
jgi:hypothetical protein